MATANPCVQKAWDEWTRGMEEDRRCDWRERANPWASGEEGDDGKDAASEEEEGGSEWEEEEREKRVQGRAMVDEEEEKEVKEEEEGTEEEDDDDVARDEEKVVKVYSKHDYPSDIFGTLSEFRASDLLTDLLLNTEDGRSLRVHSSVLASVSSLIRERLCGEEMEQKRKYGEERGVWSVPLGPGVDHLGLEAVVDFAYTGLISNLNQDTVARIKAAARSLGVSRVTDLCATEDGEKKEKNGEKTSAAEEMRRSLRSVRRLWMERVGCDVILETNGESLPVHRVLLAASCDYFRAMFTLGMRESHQARVLLPFLSAPELDALIGCSYGGSLALSWERVFELTTTARQLQHGPALSLCLSFLREELSPGSCLDVASFAAAYEMTPLLHAADDFVLRQFPKVARTLKFKDLPAPQLLKYLKSQSLCVPSEVVVFRAVVAWIQAEPQRRRKLAKELMKTVNFPLMTFKEFKEVQSWSMWADQGLVETYQAIFEDFCSSETKNQYRVYLPKEILVLIGGDRTSEDLAKRSLSTALWFGNSLRNHQGIRKAMEWRMLGEMPEPARFRHEVAVLEGQLYVFGGKKYYGVWDTLRSVHRFDPHQNRWESLADMQQKRCFFSAVVLDGKILAIGGQCDPEYLDTVETFCPHANVWRLTRPLDLPLSGHVAKVLRGQIFVSGGLNRDHSCVASLFRYDPETGSSSLADMAEPRAHHCMEELGQRLYVAGGISGGGEGSVVNRLACEVYSAEADSWTTLTPLTVPHVGSGSAVLEGKFYVLGGYNQEDYSDTNMVHRYDPATQRWENMGRMPGPNNDIRAAVLCLPPHLRL